MSTVAIFWAAAIVALEPQLGGVGERTPILPLSVMVSDLSNRAGAGGGEQRQPSTNWGLFHATTEYLNFGRLR